MSPRGAKISQLDAKLEESCGQEAPRSTQEAHLGVMLRASWPIWSAFWKHLEQKAGKQKPSKTICFFMVFDSLGGPGERLGGYVGRCWLQLGRLWLILRRCWEMLGEMRAKIAPRGAKMSPRGDKIRQLDAKLEESCGQEAPRSIQEAHFVVMLRASWSMWKAFWKHLGQKAGKQKTFKNH